MAIEIPVIAVVVLIASAARSHGRASDAFRPESDWGPGDRDEREDYEQHLLSKRRCKQHPYGPPGAQQYPYGYYDNYAMQQQYYGGYYPSYPGGGSYHM